MNDKYLLLNQFRLARRLSILGLARLMEEEGCKVHWTVLRKTLTGKNKPHDYNDIAIDNFLELHMSELLPLMSEDGKVIVGEKIKNTPL